MIEDEKTTNFTFIKVFIICFIGFFIAVLITFFIAVDNVLAIGISEFNDVTNFTPLNSGLEQTTYPQLTNNNDTFLNTQHNYTGLNIDLSEYNYIAIPFNSAWFFYIDRTCHWGSGNTSGSTDSYNYGGGCTLESSQYYTMRVWLTYQKNGVDTSQFCDYDGQLAICNVKNIDTITAVNIALYYTFSHIDIGGSSMNNATTNFKFQSRLGRAWFYMNSTQVASDIDKAIDKNIQSQEEQADRIIESQEELQKVCNDINILLNANNGVGGNLTIYGTVDAGGTAGNNYRTTTDFIEIKENIDYKLIYNHSRNTYERYCLYDSNKTLVNCNSGNGEEVLTINITNTNVKYIRFTTDIRSGKYAELKGKECKNGNQAISDNQKETNDILTDDSIDDPSNSISDMEQNLPTNSVISDLLTLPIRLFQNVINAIDGQCQTFSLGTLYGTNLSLPCINIQNLIGSQLYGVIDILLSGIFVLSIRKKFVDIFENITSLKNGGNELE